MSETAILYIVVGLFILDTFKFKTLPRIAGLIKYKIVYAIIIPTLLLSLWVTLSINEIYRIDNVMLQLTSEFGRSQLTEFDYSELTQGEKIKGTFVSRGNYLGIVGVRFWNFYRLNDDYVTFRIRESKNLDWYYQNNYKVDQFQPNGLFPFGFPVIPDSAGKTYFFEVESTHGSPGNAIGLSPIEPIFIARSKYPREYVFGSIQNTTDFAVRKFISLLFNSKFVASSYVYFLPLLIYGFYVRFRFGRITNHSKDDVPNAEITRLNSKFDSSPIIYFLPLLVYSLYLRFRTGRIVGYATNARISRLLIYSSIALDILWITRDDASLLLLISIWIFLMKVNSISKKLTYITALCLFIFAIITWYSPDINVQFISERALSWALILVSLAAAQMVVELPRQ